MDSFCFLCKTKHFKRFVRLRIKKIFQRIECLTPVKLPGDRPKKASKLFRENLDYVEKLFYMKYNVRNIIYTRNG